MQQLLGDIMAKRRDRAIAIVLGVKERECDPHLSPEASRKLRKVVLDQLNDLTDFCLDVLRSTVTEQYVLNEVFLSKLDAIHDAINELTEADSG